MNNCNLPENLSATGMQCMLAFACLLIGLSAQAAPLSGVASISMGPKHSCAVSGAGRVHCWGANQWGQLGNGTLYYNADNSFEALPAVVSRPPAAVAVPSGDSTLVLTATGAVNEWGRYQGATVSNYVPSNAQSLVAGYEHVCVLSNAGELRCWGSNFHGQLGNGGVSGAVVQGMAAGVTAVAAGAYHTCALLVSGELKCWGHNSQGQIGNGSVSASVAAPVTVGGIPGPVQSVVAGQYNTCVTLSSDGSAHCWGDNSGGQIGDGTFQQRLAPAPVTGLTGAVAQLVLGDFHGCARMVGGPPQCWGLNVSGQLGDGTNAGRPAPGPISGLVGTVSQLAAAASQTCALLDSGEVRCWGNNVFGQLGDATSISRSSPVSVNRFSGLFKAPYDLAGSAAPDLVWKHSVSGNQFLWAMAGAMLEFEAPLPATPLSWRLAGLADINRDGRNDFIWHDQATGDVKVWIMVNNTIASVLTIENVDTMWMLEVVKDFNGDGAPDLLWRHGVSGAAYLWFMDGLDLISDQLLFVVDPLWRVVGAGDFTLDGTPDLLFRHAETGLAFSWNSEFNGAAVSLTTSSPPIFSIDPVWEVMQVADWNADGKPDLLFRNSSTGLVFAWHLDGNTLTTSSYITLIDPSWGLIPRR